MLKALFVALALGGGGQRYVETSGVVPSTCDTTANGGDGLSLRDIDSCRATLRTVDGGALSTAKIVPYYCEVGATSGGGWQEGSASGICTLEAQLDGGPRVMQQCEWVVKSKFGRVAVATAAVTGPDAGTANGADGDAGYHAGPVLRLECYGSALTVVPAGGTP